MRKNYFRDFNSWLGGREKAQRAFEIKITESLEDTLWNKQYMDQFASPFLKQFPASDISSDKMDEFTNQLQEFAKGITLK